MGFRRNCQRFHVALAKFNSRRIPNPLKMRPGMKVVTPSIAVLQSRFPDACPKRRTSLRGGAVRRAGFFRDSSGRPLYRVSERDTLSGIAQKHLGRASRWIQIFQMNRDRLKDSKSLTIGTELRLPSDASNIRLVRGQRKFR